MGWWKCTWTVWMFECFCPYMSQLLCSMHSYCLAGNTNSLLGQYLFYSRGHNSADNLSTKNPLDMGKYYLEANCVSPQFLFTLYRLMVNICIKFLQLMKLWTRQTVLGQFITLCDVDLWVTDLRHRQNTLSLSDTH